MSLTKEFSLILYLRGFWICCLVKETDYEMLLKENMLELCVHKYN